MESADVAVVIPTIGRDSIRRAIASARQQTVTSRIIVVFDGEVPPHELVSTAEEYGCDLLTTGSKAGGGKARNVGSDAANTPYIAYLDDDDWWEATKLEAQLADFSRNPNNYACSTLYSLQGIDGRERLMPQRVPSRGETSANYLIQRESFRYGRTCIQSSGIMVRRECFEQTRWDETLRKHQDWDFITRVTKNSPANLGWVNLPLTYVAQGTVGSVSARGNWRASAAWLDKVDTLASQRARADFAWSLILRAALAGRSPKGVSAALARTGCSLPHWQAAAVGILGGASAALRGSS